MLVMLDHDDRLRMLVMLDHDDRVRSSVAGAMIDKLGRMKVTQAL